MFFASFDLKLDHHEDALLYNWYNSQKTAKKQVTKKKIAKEKALISNKKDLFLILLKVYLKIDNGTGNLLRKIIHLLNTQAIYMDILIVLVLLSESWSVRELPKIS
ncbi:vacuolar sorting protein 39 domain 2-domain-containing protein [Gigaspora margarita]|uniref:Vacuolar sorting protein 39 domain 2-domain-containing protein n=1 Tax=Gigaspora margarita TaxID=4874 RepID=A0A8H3XGB6_GIGMA|nr:vacuolar sorting protein 39 domain 2-domain-containing protein [Gigaspora margarita]